MGKKKFLIFLVVILIIVALLLSFPSPSAISVTISEINSNPSQFSNSIIRAMGTVLLSYPSASVIEEEGEVIYVLNVSEVYDKSDRIEVIGKVITVDMGEGKIDRWIEAISTRQVGKGYSFQPKFYEVVGDQTLVLNDSHINKLMKISNLTLVSFTSSPDGRFFLLNFTQLNVECFLRKAEIDSQLLKEGENYEILGFLTYITTTYSSLFRIVEIYKM
ncbi:MAG: hypothetical protein QW507_02605 [Candidatus Nanoarchaeia archaeon]|nr:hypothetical protein [Candidatus Haiyanarchaeum thermophilum]MCW1303347.1 hypothetical protein [Candidatus Haiyanarchaeum thermophilum]MCW1304071.1 hypothetical protein [Candidatus Haiyanarchaeum thermophilum]MCW1306507.1 hypothetical protein [Candidatus Haiyanarchaeum thermophilum]MCW1307541.1 hypothetical protein [Candidatus Haiyanarchaeum thermophilum]